MMSANENYLINIDKDELEIKGWLICIISALFFFYQFLQFNLVNSISSELVLKWSLTPYSLSLLSSAYLYALIMFYFPAGYLLDNYSTRKLILIGMCISISACVIFAFANSYKIALLSRFIMGSVHALSFLGCIALAQKWIAKCKDLAMGVAITIGVLGGLSAQFPLIISIHQFGMKMTLILDFTIGILILLLIYLFVEDSPFPSTYNRLNNNIIQCLFNIYKACINVANWLCGLYVCLLNLPVMLLGAVWGDLYFINITHFTKYQASLINAALFLGIIIGCPLVGMLSDKINNRKLIMIFGALLSLLVAMLFYWLSHPSFYMAICIFTLLGCLTSTQILSFAIVNDINLPDIKNVALSLASIITMGGGIFFQWIFAKELNSKSASFGSLNYQHAYLIIPFCFFIGFILSLLIKDNSFNFKGYQ